MNNYFIFNFFVSNPLLFLNTGHNQNTSVFSFCKPTGCGKRHLTGLRWNQLYV